jgi:hypothetical protein
MWKWIFFDEHILNYESYFFGSSEFLTEVTSFVFPNLTLENPVT